MKVETFVCDLAGCSKPSVGHYKVFKSSQPDGAGSSSSYYSHFDLCQNHAESYFNAILNTTIEAARERLRAMNIRTETY